MARRTSALDRASAALSKGGSFAARKKTALDSEASDDAAELNVSEAYKIDN